MSPFIMSKLISPQRACLKINGITLETKYFPPHPIADYERLGEDTWHFTIVHGSRDIFPQVMPESDQMKLRDSRVTRAFSSLNR
jgi:hypothetical protein